MKKQTIAEIEEAQRLGKLFVSDASVLEAARLSHAGRIYLGGEIEDFVRLAQIDGGLAFLPMTHRILIESTRLPELLHKDPSDRIIAATAREYGLTLLTRDKPLLRYAQQGHLNARKI
ncbi:MAG: type II toxin-antitoxin system VapC family toxin [Acidobacteriaceae bacterium]|nr:type II toxin-antitoxin system VapC family toxin [Acidobacteriaceae bacterium]